MSEWRTDEPPKNGCFLADVGFPWPVVAVWNGVGDGYVYAELNCSIGEDGWNDTYFETEGYCEVKRWMSLPELPKGDA